MSISLLAPSVHAVPSIYGYTLYICDACLITLVVCRKGVKVYFVIRAFIPAITYIVIITQAQPFLQVPSGIVNKEIKHFSTTSSKNLHPSQCVAYMTYAQTAVTWCLSYCWAVFESFTVIIKIVTPCFNMPSLPYRSLVEQ